MKQFTLNISLINMNTYSTIQKFGVSKKKRKEINSFFFFFQQGHIQDLTCPKHLNFNVQKDDMNSHQDQK